MDTLKDLYIDQLQDLWSANRQARKVIEQFAEAANDRELCEKLQSGLKRIDEHNQRLEQIIRNYGASPTGEHCKGMEGLVAEAKKHALETEYTNEDVHDAQIIAQYQRMIHYGIAVYGTSRALADQLGFSEDVRILAEDLQNVKDGDKVMNRIAEESVNRRAA